jgi:hypothetical protein
MWIEKMPQRRLPSDHSYVQKKKGNTLMYWNFTCIFRRLNTQTTRSLVILTVFFLQIACAMQPNQCTFNPKTCLETIPKHVKGLSIVSGPRSEKSIIRDMVPAICSAHALFRHMKSEGHEMNSGSVVFRVVVEYTGEVANVSVKETEIHSKRFLREVSDFIMDSDFVLWAGDESDTVFLYPATFCQ